MRCQIMARYLPINGGWPVHISEGLNRHGVQVYVSDTPDYTVDFFVFWGHKRDALIRELRQRGIPYLVVERAYLGNRFEWFSLGWNGLNGDASFCNANSPSDRWDKHWQDVMQPWQPNPDGYILTIGQVMGDASLGMLDVGQWYRATQKRYAKAGKVVMHREHPDMVAGKKSDPIRPEATLITGPLIDALKGASQVVTYSSNVGVDAVMLGIPTISCSKTSMAWSVTDRLYEKPSMPDRTQWAHNLAYCQWLPHEIANGEAWDHLRAGCAT